MKPFNQQRLQDATSALHKNSDKSANRHLFHPAIPSTTTSNCIVEKKPLGAVLLAGGQSTRMGLSSSTPKALLETSPILKKTLIQLFFEKVLSFQFFYKSPIEIALFVSESTHRPIKEFLDGMGNFGFPSSSLHYIEQPSLPFFDENGNYILDTKGEPLSGPDGNGSLFYTMEQHHLFDTWMRKEITHCSTTLIDNPLVDPFHLQLLYRMEQNDILFSAITKASEEEKVGLFVKEQGTEQLKVIEYSQIESLRSSIEAPWHLSDFSWANISQFCFSLAWAKKNCMKKLPWHIAKKSSHGHSYYKMEQFFFDILEYAEKSDIVGIERDLYFAPIKQLKGQDSLEEAQQKMMKKAKKIYKQVTGQSTDCLEIHPFWEYYTTMKQEFLFEADEIESLLSESGYLAPPTEFKVQT